MKRVTVLTLILALAAVVPTFAQAKPLPSAGNDRAHYGSQQATDVAAPTSVTPDDRPYSRVPIESSPTVVKADDGWSVDSGNAAILTFAIVLGVLAGAAGMAVWRSRRLSPA
jgi:hypothetical protein